MWVVGDGAVGEAREVGLDGPEIRLASITTSTSTSFGVSSPVNVSVDVILADAAALADLPDLLCRPLSRPFRIDEGVGTGGRPYRRLHLDDVDHLESVSPQQADPIAEAEVELDSRIVRHSKR